QIFPAQLSTKERGCSYPAIKNPPLLDDFRREWYSSQILAAGEPSMVSIAEGAAPEAKHLRFVWLRSFHAPAIIQVSVIPDGGATLTAELLHGAGGYELGKVSHRVEL